jgi:hypothetical protein
MTTGTVSLMQSLTVRAMRPIVPAKDFEISKKFYLELGFRPQTLADRLVEMHFGAYSFILQDYYIEQWANNFVMHVSVADLDHWWKHIRALDLTSRYGVRTGAPKLENWGMVAGLTDPSGVLWRFSQSANHGQTEVPS